MDAAQDIYNGFLFDVSEPKEYAAESARMLFLVLECLLELVARNMAFFAQNLAYPGLTGPGLILDRGF